MALEHLFDDQLVAVLPRGHALSRRRVLEWRHIAEEPFIGLQAQAGLVRDGFAQNGIDKRTEHEVLNTVTALRMTRAGFGMCWASKRKSASACRYSPSITTAAGISPERPACSAQACWQVAALGDAGDVARLTAVA